MPKPGESTPKVTAGPMAEIAVLKKLSHANVIKLYTVLDDPAGPSTSP